MLDLPDRRPSQAGTSPVAIATPPDGLSQAEEITFYKKALTALYKQLRLPPLTDRPPLPSPSRNAILPYPQSQQSNPQQQWQPSLQSQVDSGRLSQPGLVNSGSGPNPLSPLISSSGGVLNPSFPLPVSPNSFGAPLPSPYFNPSQLQGLQQRGYPAGVAGQQQGGAFQQGLVGAPQTSPTLPTAAKIQNRGLFSSCARCCG